MMLSGRKIRKRIRVATIVLAIRTPYYQAITNLPLGTSQKNRRGYPRRLKVEGRIASLLGDVARNELSHLKHTDRHFTVEDGLQLIVGIDLCAHLRILKIVLLDIHPELFSELSARKGVGTNYSGESIIRCDRFHECGIGFTCGFFSHNYFLVRVLLVEDSPHIEG